MAKQTKNTWVTYEHNRAIKTYGKYLGYAISVNNPIANDYIKDVLPLAENNYWSLTGMANSLLEIGSPNNVHIAEKYLKKAKLLGDDQRSSKINIAYLFYMEGLIAKKKGNSRKARNLFRKSIKIKNTKNNPSYKALKEL